MTRYVKSSTPRNARPVPWWDRHCTLAQKHVDVAFSRRAENPDAYKSARQVLRSKQKTAYARYRKAIRAKLAEDHCSKEWWVIVKLHSGKGGSRVSSAPPPEEMAKYFAEKLSLNGAENDPVPEFDAVMQGKLSSFRITQYRVKRVLKQLNPNKSVNGISNRFLKHCAFVLTPAITVLFQRIAKDGVWPTR